MNNSPLPTTANRQKYSDSLKASSFIQRLSAKIANSANPMLVRIIRQELRSKTFIGVFVLLLVVSAFAAIACAGMVNNSTYETAGSNLYGILAFAWTLVIAIQAMNTFQAVTRERNEDTWDLLDLTGMGPRLVLRGLLLANIVQGQLYTAALAPFLVMAYLLRGIDLISIGFALVVIPLAGVAASTLAVFMASIGNNKASRAFCQSILGLGLFLLWGVSSVLWFSIHELGWFFSLFIRNPSEAWLILGLGFNMWLAFVITMLVLSGALMTHRASDRSTGPRLLWYALWLNALVWLVGFAVYESKSYFEVNDALRVFSVFGVIWAGVLGLFSISEPYELSPRQERTISQAPAWRKIFTLIHGPGAARGRWAFLLLSALSLVIGTIGMLLDPQDPNKDDDLVLFAWILSGYLCILFVVSDWCYRGFARRWLDTAGLRRGFILLAAALWMLGPILIGAALEMGSVDHSIIALISPIMGLAKIIEDQDGNSDVLALIYTIVGIIAIAVLIFQATRLRVTTYRVTALADDKNPRGE
jgi:hypothetical protein